MLSTPKIIFRKTKDRWGFLSNMCSGYPIDVGNNEIFLTSEALYQALKFKEIDIQREIMNAKSPMTAKLISRKYSKEGKEIDNWNDIRVDVMMFCLVLKAANNEDFVNKLKETKYNEIIEFDKDHNSFWGMNTYSNSGENNLGKLLMELRDIYLSPSSDLFDAIASFDKSENYRDITLTLLGNKIVLRVKKRIKT